jgi:quinol monooxygenase YgiN
MLSLSQAFTSMPASYLHQPTTPSPTGLGAGNESEEKPFAVVVQATIEPDRMAEFLTLIKTNAEETRKEPGCIRFDVLRSQDSPNEFFFYELYKGISAIDYHKVNFLVLHQVVKGYVISHCVSTLFFRKIAQKHPETTSL